MEYYDPLFIQQLAPLMIVDSSNSIDQNVLNNLVKNFNKSNVSSTLWDNSIIKNRLLSMKYIINYIKTSGDADANYNVISSHKIKDETEHSRLSPFNIDSDLFPNGLLSYKWFKKYIKELPFAYITILNLPENEENDARLVEQINKMKLKYHELNIKFIAIIISSGEDIDRNDDRIGAFRQLTNLPRLTGLLHLQNHSESPTVDLERDSDILVTSLLSNLKNSASDFYSGIEYRIKQRYKKYYSCPSTKHILTAIELSPTFLETRNLIKQAIINEFTYPNNLESSLKLLEASYELTIQLLREITYKFVSLPLSKVSDHDINLYKQIRSLIDMIAFHIVRGYFSIEQPIASLRKHQAHISNVVDVLKSVSNSNYNQWISIQYQWLGELMNLVPKSILLDVHSKFLRKKSKNLKYIEFFGGLHFHDHFQQDILTHPGLIFLKSASLLNSLRFKKNSSKLKLLQDIVHLDENSITIRKINLLEDSKKAFLESAESKTNRSSNEVHDQYTSFIRYTNWLIGEEYSAVNSGLEALLNEAINAYESALNTKSSSDLSDDKSMSSWTGITQVIMQKLLQCYISKKDIDKTISSIFQLSQSSGSSISIAPSLTFPLFEYTSGHADIELDQNKYALSNFFEIDILLLDQESKEDGCFVYDTIVTQLIIKPKINLNILKSLINENDLTLKLFINKIELVYSNTSKNVILSHDESVKSLIFQSNFNLEKTSNQNDEYLKGSMNFNIFDDDKNQTFSNDGSIVVQFTQIAEKAGVHLIRSIKLTPTLQINSDKNAINFHKNESITLTELEELHNDSINRHDRKYYSPASSNRNVNSFKDLPSKLIRLNNQYSHVIKIQSMKPDISIKMETNSLSSIIMGEKLSIPFKIIYKNPKEHEVFYNQISLSANVSVVYSEQDPDFSTDLSTRVHWDSLKDDELLSLDDLVLGSDGEQVHNLSITLHNSLQNRDDKVNSYRLLIDFKTTVLEEQEDGPEGGAENAGLDRDSSSQMFIYETASYSLPIINNPFGAKFVISPRYREEDSTDMPNPFVFNEITDESNNSIPIASRLWIGKLSLTDNSLLLNKEKENFEKLEIELYSLNIKTKNTGLIVDMVGTSTLDSNLNHDITQLFDTKSKHGYSHRNVSIVAHVQVKWKRHGCDIVNEYESNEWEIILPLSDPRVLLLFKESEQGEGMFKYILENPTPRIFTFTTQLINEYGSEESETTHWNFENDRNIIPLKQSAFPVLPFTRHEMIYYGKYADSGDNKVIRLPQLKVFDVHYKISLPTLSATDNVAVNNNVLFWHK